MSDTTPLGFIVLALNTHGVAETFGPYLSEEEAHDAAEFACHLVPTWLADLDTGTLERYGAADARDELPAKAVRRAPKAKAVAAKPERLGRRFPIVDEPAEPGVAP